MNMFILVLAVTGCTLIIFHVLDNVVRALHSINETLEKIYDTQSR